MFDELFDDDDADTVADEDPTEAPVPLFERPYVIELMARIAAWEADHPDVVARERRSVERERRRRERRRERARRRRRFPHAC